MLGEVQVMLRDLRRSLFISLTDRPLIPAGSLLRAEIIMQKCHDAGCDTFSLQVIAATLPEPSRIATYLLDELQLHSCSWPD